MARGRKKIYDDCLIVSVNLPRNMWRNGSKIAHSNHLSFSGYVKQALEIQNRKETKKLNP